MSSLSDHSVVGSQARVAMRSSDLISDWCVGWIVQPSRKCVIHDYVKKGVLASLGHGYDDIQLDETCQVGRCKHAESCSFTHHDECILLLIVSVLQSNTFFIPDGLYY